MTIAEKAANYMPDEINPDYSLSIGDRNELLAEETKSVGHLLNYDETNVLVTGGSTPLANVVRSIEAEKLPSIPELMEDYEDSSRFVLVLEDREEGDSGIIRPAHVFRINSSTDTEAKNKQPTGLPTFDDVLKLGKATEEELLSFYETQTLKELGQEYLNVETNIAIEGVRLSIKKPYAALGYRAIFDLVRMEDVRGVVAYQNPEAMRSMTRIGLRHTPLIGNPDISVEDIDKASSGTEDHLYYPLTIESVPWSRLQDSSPQHNNLIFTNPRYAEKFSRIAALVASKSLNIINIA